MEPIFTAMPLLHTSVEHVIAWSIEILHAELNLIDGYPARRHAMKTLLVGNSECFFQWWWKIAQNIFVFWLIQNVV